MDRMTERIKERLSAIQRADEHRVMAILTEELGQGWEGDELRRGRASILQSRYGLVAQIDGRPIASMTFPNARTADDGRTVEFEHGPVRDLRGGEPCGS